MAVHHRRSALPAPLLLTLLALMAAASLLWAMAAGSLPVPPNELWQIASGAGEGLQQSVVTELRLPRALSAFAVGGMLALAGALMQVLLGNPLADPYVLGISGGAAVGALLAILAGAGGGMWLNSGAFGGALFTMVLVFGLSRGRGAWSPTRLLLTGVVVAAGWGALISLLLAIAPDQQLRGMLFWLMGDLSQTGLPGTTLLGPPGAVLLLALALSTTVLLGRSLNLMARGELQAGALGVNVRRLRLAIYLLASLLTAVAVTLGGSIGFIGLLAPHMLRLLGASDHRLLLPASALLGGALLVAADTLARTVIAPQQLPVGVLTALLGVPLFLLLLNRSPRT